MGQTHGTGNITYCIYVRDAIIDSQAYIPKSRTLIQVLPPANVYTKSANAYIQKNSVYALWQEVPKLVYSLIFFSTLVDALGTGRT